MKEVERLDKYLDLARELKKTVWKMKVTAIPTDPKKTRKTIDELKIRGSIQTTTLLKSIRILRRVLEI